MRFYDTTTLNYIKAEEYWPDERIWYKDSLVIYEIKLITVTRNGLTESRNVSVKNYTFLDLRTKTFYDYLTFSDTASLLKVYAQADSIKTDLWAFYSPPEFHSLEQPLIISDTVINQVHYRRSKIVYEIPQGQDKVRQNAIAYFRCDKKGTLFSFDRSLSMQMGCPWVRTDNIPLVPNAAGTVSQQINFTADHLSEHELTVFNAWEKKANEKNKRK